MFSQHSISSSRKGGAVVGDAVLSPPCRAFHCNTAGTVTVRLAGDTADVTLTCTAGTVYPYSVVIFRATALTGAYVWLL
jgi:hypothetical protein